MNRKPARIPRWLLLAGPLLAALGFVAVADLRPEREPAPARLVHRAVATGDLRAGAGKARIELPADVPLAGYRFLGRVASEGESPIHARSLLLEAAGARVAVVLVELMTLPQSLSDAIEERARAEGAGCTLVVASHTHSGPGGYDPAFLPQMAIGRYDPTIVGAILDAVSASLAAARAELGPALLAVGESRVSHLASNRDRKGEPVDDRLTALALRRPDGTRVASLVRLAAHPTLTPKHVGPSGDWPGFAMERLEESEGGVAFVIQGAGGDARPSREAAVGDGAIRPLLFAEAVAEAVRGVELEGRFGPLPLGCAEVAFDLPRADLAGMVPPGLGRLVSNLASSAAPAQAEAVVLRLAEIALVGVPAEPMARGAEAIETPAERAGLRGRVVGLAQGYVSYGVGPEEMEARSISARNAWFGADLQPRLVEAAEAATRALLEADRVAAP